MAIHRRAHVERIHSYILVWNGDEQEQLGFDGEVFYMPPTNETAVRTEGGKYRLESARDEQGTFIPGTILVQDRWAVIDGNRMKVFDADEFVRWLEQTREDLINRGLVVVDFAHEVEEARKLGRPNWEKSQDIRARALLEAELFRRRKWEEKGTPAPPSSSEHLVLWAIKHLNERGAQLSLVPTDDIVGALSGRPVTPKANAAAELSALMAPASSIRGLPGAAGPAPKAPAAASGIPGGNEVYATARRMGISMKKEELEGLLADDVAAIKAVTKRIEEKRDSLKTSSEEVAAQ